jgi:hypothetical protein
MWVGTGQRRSECSACYRALLAFGLTRGVNSRTLRVMGLMEEPNHQNVPDDALERELDRRFVLSSGKPVRPDVERYWDDEGFLAEVVPTDVVLAVRKAIESPPPPDAKKAKRLASLLRRAREG